MKKTFRIVGYLEGLSFLALLFVAMPIKYVWGDPSVVRSVGSAHGALFVAYVVLLAIIQSNENWPSRVTMQGVLASMLPFGPFIFERRMAKAGLL